MSLVERLGALQLAPSGVDECAVCRWYAKAEPKDRAAFDEWLSGGGSISALWRACASDPVNPLTIRRPRFGELINDHHRGGARVAC